MWRIYIDPMYTLIRILICYHYHSLQYTLMLAEFVHYDATHKYWLSSTSNPSSKGDNYSRLWESHIDPVYTFIRKSICHHCNSALEYGDPCWDTQIKHVVIVVLTKLWRGNKLESKLGDEKKLVLKLGMVYGKRKDSEFGDKRGTSLGFLILVMRNE